MKKLLALTFFTAVFLTVTATSSASWFGGNNNDRECWTPWGDRPGCNPYDEWDPRYWMEEMSDIWDDDDDDYYRYGGGYGGYPYGGGYGGYPYGGGYGGGYAPQGGYGGYAAPQGGYAAPAPAPAPQAAPAQ